MKIEVVLIDWNSTSDDKIKMDEYTKEYVKHVIKSKSLVHLKDVCEKDHVMTPDEVNWLKTILPTHYLFIDPGKDDNWFNNPTILDIINKFNMVVINSMKMVTTDVNDFIEIFKHHKTISNYFDYSHKTFIHVDCVIK